MKTIVYVSTAAVRFDETDLEALLATTRTKNSARDVSGMLVFCGGNFLQVLEGPAGTVDDVFAAIGADPRHRDIRKILDIPITARQFGDWSMAFSHARNREAFDGAINLIGEAEDMAGRLAEDNSLRKIILGFVERNQRIHGLA
jgi:hypothetical protein